ncbi:rare lipoprotein A [uncultured Gammaproteobacteria bacterium]
MLRLQKSLRVFLVATVGLGLAGCAGGPEKPGEGHQLPSGGMYKVGKPYQVSGVWYYPAEDYSYDETGIASWYGPGFHKEQTANGESFNQEEVTAAHKTLPMPSLVRVVNLDNGRSLVVRVNDRGPFVAGRIIDMSKRSAHLLGFEGTGTAKVRVTVLADESRALAAAARANAPAAQLVAENGPPPKVVPRAKIEVENLGGSVVTPSPLAAAVLGPSAPRVIEPPRTVAGTTSADGRFLPAPQVTQMAVHSGRQMYIQAGSFTVAENANRLRSRLSALGPASVSQAKVGRAHYYRVRVGPIETVERADAVLNQVIGTGTGDARIVVD